jgi:LacI family transcriptional regulator
MTCQGGAQAMNRLLELPVRPTAVLSAHTLMTLGVLQTLARRGLPVPDAVVVSSFDDLPYPWAETLRPHLTTVSRPTYELGRTATETLVRVLRQPQAPVARRVVVDGPLVVRD